MRYTKPSNNPLRDTVALNTVASFTDKGVTNSTVPTFSGGTAAGRLVTVNFSGPLKPGDCAALDAWTIKLDGVSYGPNSLRCEEQSVLLWLPELTAPRVRVGQTVTVSYDKSKADQVATFSSTTIVFGRKLKSPVGADVASFTDQAVRWCVGADCETVRPRANTGFVEATTRLNMALELGGDEFDRNNLRFFTGQRRACHIKLFGLANCCKNSGLLVGLGNCSASERELAEERHAGNTHYLGRYCSKRTFFGVCIRRSRAWCVFGSKLGRILQQQGRRQLGIGWGSCRGFTVAEIEGIDFASVDLSEFTQDLMDGSREPSVSLPDAGDTGTAMRTRIRDFYRRGR